MRGKRKRGVMYVIYRQMRSDMEAGSILVYGERVMRREGINPKRTKRIITLYVWIVLCEMR
jgi:hypothetical protein